MAVSRQRHPGWCGAHSDRGNLVLPPGCKSSPALLRAAPCSDGAALLLAMALPLALAGWGLGQAQRLTENLLANPQRCVVLPVNHH